MKAIARMYLVTIFDMRRTPQTYTVQTKAYTAEDAYFQNEIELGKSLPRDTRIVSVEPFEE